MAWVLYIYVSFKSVLFDWLYLDITLFLWYNIKETEELFFSRRSILERSSVLWRGAVSGSRKITVSQKEEYMAIHRAALIGNGTVSQSREDGVHRSRTGVVSDGIEENTLDHSLPRAEDFSPGSRMPCLENQKSNIKYRKSPR